MIPIVLDPGTTAFALVGRGEVACRRLEWLLAGGADGVQVYADRPSAALAQAAGDRLRRQLPDAAALGRLRLLWIADLPLAEAVPLARQARAAGVLVNVEDVIGWCDFHNPSVVRRGELLLTVSTGGKSPGLAARIRRELAERFGPEWALRLERLGARRTAWRRRARPLNELVRLTDAMIDHQRWLPREHGR
jgi:precorrin-2 dehydrogenase / sirohydrochlorin ferrochelatase